MIPDHGTGNQECDKDGDRADDRNEVALVGLGLLRPAVHRARVLVGVSAKSWGGHRVLGKL